MYFILPGLWLRFGCDWAAKSAMKVLPIFYSMTDVLRCTLFSLGMVARLEEYLLGMQSAPEFDPYVRHILSWRLGHEKITTAILPLPLNQEEQL